MKRPFALLLPFLLAAGASLQAGAFAQLKDEIATARKELVTLALYRDKRGPEQQKRVKATAETVSVHLAKLKAPVGKEAEFKELAATWDAFRKTREADLVPAILANQKERYEKIGAGIQKERLDRMYALIDALEK